MTTKKVLSIMESILFASGDPVPVDRFCRTLEMDKSTVENLLSNLIDGYRERNSGIQIVRLDNRVQMVTDPENGDFVRSALEIRKKPSLSATALEVLAIIAYKQPVTRQAVEAVRGIDSSYTIGMLSEKGLIYEADRLDVPGRPILYRTTEDFLRCFGLTSLKDLPNMPELPIEPEQTMLDNGEVEDNAAASSVPENRDTEGETMPLIGQ